MTTPAKLLLIDDLADNIEVLGEHLSDAYDIEFALSGPEALARIEQSPPDLILLDVMMPEMDGYAVCAALKRNPRTQDIPILFVTAKNDAESESRALAAGAVDFIHKPVNRDVVRARVRVHLDLQARKRELEALNAQLRTLNADLEQRVKERTQGLRDALLRADAAYRAKHLFLANVNHELRTPMNAILGLSGMLARQVADPGLQQRVDKIRSACRQLLGTINEIIDVADLQAGKVRIESIDFELPALLQGSLEKWRKRAEDKGLALALDIDPALPAYLRGDPGRLSQVLENLLRNAVNFSEKGTIALRAHLAESQENALSVRFEVEDQGIGIEEGHRSLIFNVFEQVDASSTRRYGGAGIGLALCKQLTELMDGSITVDSTPGQGSTFRIVLPLSRGTRTRPAAPRGDAPARQALCPLPDWEQAQYVIVPLLGMLAADDIQAYMVWRAEGHLLDAVLGEQAGAFHQAMENVDFGTALELLISAHAFHSARKAS